jgi:hypothetical protein
MAKPTIVIFLSTFMFLYIAFFLILFWAGLAEDAKAKGESAFFYYMMIIILVCMMMITIWTNLL